MAKLSPVKKSWWLVGLGAAAAMAWCRMRSRRLALALHQGDAVFRHTREAILFTDAQRRIVGVNPAFTAITGYTAAEVMGQDPRLQHSGRQDEAFYRGMWAALRETGQWEGEIWNRRKNGEVYAAWENISAIRDRHGVIEHYVAVMADITPLADARQQLAHLAHHDVLTGLPNRLLLIASLERAVARAKRHGHRLAVLFIDLDRFKHVNDTFGHAAGDELLRAVARRLRGAVRAEDLLARLSGDEFVVVFEAPDPGDAARLAGKVRAALSGPFLLGEHAQTVSASIGVALYPDDGDTAEALLCASDAAMYRAKHAVPRGAERL